MKRIKKAVSIVIAFAMALGVLSTAHGVHTVYANSPNRNVHTNVDNSSRGEIMAWTGHNWLRMQNGGFGVWANGTTAELRADAFWGYEFSHWDASVFIPNRYSPDISFTVFEDVWVTANFRPVGQAQTLQPFQNQEFSITLSSNDWSLGTVSAFTARFIGAGLTASPGQTVSLIADIQPGAEFIEWRVVRGDIWINNPNSPTTSFTMGHSDVEVRGYFRRSTPAPTPPPVQAPPPVQTPPPTPPPVQTPPTNVTRIRTEAQLRAISNGTTGHYVLENDIHLTSEWVPIHNFRGTFDGQGHVVRNLFILESSRREVAGLFGLVMGDWRGESAIIRNVGVEIGTQGVTASARDWTGGSSQSAAGGLAAIVAYALVENSFVIGTGSVSSRSTDTPGVGGLIGFSQDSTVRNSRSSVNVYFNGFLDGHSGPQFSIGGLIGDLNGGRLERSFATGSVNVSLPSVNSDFTVSAGGLIGAGWVNPSSVTIIDSFATGNVNVTSNSQIVAGGLVGGSFGHTGSVSIHSSYAAGNVFANGGSNTSRIGGIIGHNGAWNWGGLTTDVRNSFRLSTQILSGATLNSSGTSLNANQMRTQSSFTGWDFNNVWTIRTGENNGFPVLRTGGTVTLPPVTTPPPTQPPVVTPPPTTQEFPITVSSNDWSLGSASAEIDSPITWFFIGGGITASPGQRINLTAEIMPGATFERWEVVRGNVSISNVNSPNAHFVMDSSAVEIVAHFRGANQPPQAQEFPITVSSNDWALGSTSAAVESVFSPHFIGGGVMASPGETIRLTAENQPGAIFVEWRVIRGGVVISNIRSQSTTFIMGNSAVEIEGVFRSTAPIPPANPNVITPIVAGRGTASDPYIIQTAGQLAWLSQQVRVMGAGNNPTQQSYDNWRFWGNAHTHFRLANDIDLSLFGQNWNNGMGWIPIGGAGVGSVSYPFFGVFDGGGHTITGLYINIPANARWSGSTFSSVGLFGSVGGTIKNLHVEGVVYNQLSHASGGIVGNLAAGSISEGMVYNSSFIGVVHGRQHAGGIAGSVGHASRGGIVRDSYSAGFVTSGTGVNDSAGGITGFVTHQNSIVEGNTSSVSVVGGGRAGGIVGSTNANVWIANNTALNPYVQATPQSNVFSAYAGRIIGRVWPNEATGNILSGNRALATMHTNNGGVHFPAPGWIYNVHNNVNGEDFHP